MYCQGQKLVSIQFFSMIHPITNKLTSIKKGGKFTVVSAIQNNNEYLIISRSKSAKIGVGYTMKISDVDTLFEKVK